MARRITTENSGQSATDKLLIEAIERILPDMAAEQRHRRRMEADRLRAGVERWRWAGFTVAIAGSVAALVMHYPYVAAEILYVALMVKAGSPGGNTPGA